MKTKIVNIGKIKIGGGNPVVVQSMTNTKTYDIKATLSQIRELEKAGCEIVRVSVPDKASAKALLHIKKETAMPLVADIHFKPSLAIDAIAAGVNKVRINPGTIKDKGRLKEITVAAKERKIAIRIGVNAGSLPKELEDLKHKDLAKALLKGVKRSIAGFEDEGFFNIVVSCKASNVVETIKAYQELSQEINYPLHLGITEAGTLLSGSIKSAVGLGVLLHKGIGDTIRVSLTANPVEEVRVAYRILSALDIRKCGVDLISCPSCARSNVDVISLANKVEQVLADVKEPLKVAVMGCEVNGPGEAKEADVGVAAGKSSGLIFTKGKILGKYKESELFDKLMKEINKLIAQREQ